MASPTAHADSAAAPLDGYDGLDTDELMTRLAGCSQEQLTSIEAYEGSHQDRDPVMKKLRYLRGKEPFEGYDGLDEDRILTNLDGADLATLHATRGYEAKLRNRPKIMEGVDRLRTAKRPREAPGPAHNAAPGHAAAAGLKAAASGVGVTLLLGFAIVLLIVSVCVGGLVVLSLVAPNALN